MKSLKRAGIFVLIVLEFVFFAYLVNVYVNLKAKYEKHDNDIGGIFSKINQMDETIKEDIQTLNYWNHTKIEGCQSEISAIHSDHVDDIEELDFRMEKMDKTIRSDHVDDIKEHEDRMDRIEQTINDRFSSLHQYVQVTMSDCETAIFEIFEFGKKQKDDTKGITNRIYSVEQSIKELTSRMDSLDQIITDNFNIKSVE